MVAAVPESWKTVLPVWAVVGLATAPAAVQVIGECVEEEASSPSRYRLGLWIQLVAEFIYIIGLAVVLPTLPGIFPRDLVFFFVLAGGGFLAALITMVDCSLPLLGKERLSRRYAESVNQWTAILIAFAFTTAVAIMMFKSPRVELMGYATALFFSGCLAIGIRVQWIKHKLGAPATVASRKAVTLSDVFISAFGLAGLLLALEAMQLPGYEHQAYCLGVGAIFALFAFIVEGAKARQLIGSVSSFVSTREGILELHRLGWVLYRWENFADVFLTSIGSVNAVAMIVAEEPANGDHSAPPEDRVQKSKFDRWNELRGKRRERWIRDHGVDLYVLEPACRFGIVSLWHGAQLAMNKPPQADGLPSMSEFIGSR